MKPEFKITDIILFVLLSLTVNVSAQKETTLNTKGDSNRNDTIMKHNDFIFKHVEAMKKEAAKSDKEFNKEAYLEYAREMKKHASSAREYLRKLHLGEESVKKSETKFNKTIKHYDRILQEEFQIEKELDMPAADRHKLAYHLSLISDELKKIKKEI